LQCTITGVSGIINGTKVNANSTTLSCNASGASGSITYTCSGGSLSNLVNNCIILSCTGGNIINTTAYTGDVIHAFTSGSATLTRTKNLTAKVLVVAGGGAGWGVGGAGAGSNPAGSYTGGNGGPSVNYSSIFSTNFGHNGWFASGGGGSGKIANGGAGGTASAGGGANGTGNNTTPAAAMNNTGGGANSGIGGSGIVLIRYTN
jgi:hypothetical protein